MVASVSADTIITVAGMPSNPDEIRVAVVQRVRATGHAERAAFTLPGGRLLGWAGGHECCTDCHSTPDFHVRIRLGTKRCLPSCHIATRQALAGEGSAAACICISRYRDRIGLSLTLEWSGGGTVSNIFGEGTLETRAILKYSLCLWYSVLLIISELPRAPTTFSKGA